MHYISCELNVIKNTKLTPYHTQAHEMLNEAKPYNNQKFFKCSLIRKI